MPLWHLTVTKGQPHPPSLAASCFGKGRLPREAPAAGRVPTEVKAVGARAPNGHTATPPRRPTNSRRFIRCPRRPKGYRRPDRARSDKIARKRSMRGIEAPSQCPSLHFPRRFGSYPTSAKAAAMSATGQSRHFGGLPTTSALPPMNRHRCPPTACLKMAPDAVIQSRRRHKRARGSFGQSCCPKAVNHHFAFD